MKISKMSESGKIVDEMFEKKQAANNVLDNKAIVNISDKITEDSIPDEREKIEACAKNNSKYYYASNIDQTIKSELKEYAVVCGLPDNNFLQVEQKTIDSIKKVQSSNKPQMQKLANTDTITKKTSKFDAIKFDPFKLENIQDDNRFKKQDWQKVDKQSNLKEQPSVIGGSIIPIRGGEDYSKNIEQKTVRSRNSINNPDTIEKYIKDDKLDNGQRIRLENSKKQQNIDQRHKDWENEKLSNMEHKDMLPRGKVFPTEVLNANSGISDSIGVYSKKDLKDLPDKTDGEKIKEQNEIRRKSIQREAKDKHEFKLEKENKLDISDIFGEELKKHIKK